jgi:hypothetical protein
VAATGEVPAHQPKGTRSVRSQDKTALLAGPRALGGLSLPLLALKLDARTPLPLRLVLKQCPVRFREAAPAPRKRLPVPKQSRLLRFREAGASHRRPFVQKPAHLVRFRETGPSCPRPSVPKPARLVRFHEAR